MEELNQSTVNPKSLRVLVARHPMIVFIVLAYGISWVAYSLSNQMNLGASDGMGIIFSLGPALAAIITSAIISPQPIGVVPHRRWLLFGVIGALALAVMSIRRQWITTQWAMISSETTTSVAYPSPLSFPMDLVGAAAVAFVFSGILSRLKGTRELFRSFDLRIRPVRWYWWIIALGLYPSIMALSYVLSAALGQPLPAFNLNSAWYLVVLDALLAFGYFLIGGGGPEEPGWRGFALPLLQKRFNPLLSSLILAAIWGFWHLPFFWFKDSLGISWVVAFAIYLLLEIIPYSILFTAVFNRSGGSLPIVILLHASINVTYNYLPAASLFQPLWLLMILGLTLWMWRAPKIFSISKT